MSDDASARENREPAYPATARADRLRQLTPKAMWAAAAAVAVLTTAAVVLLWWPTTSGLNGAELVRARLDALKIGLSFGLGSGGAIALYLAWRRQHSTEADLDTRERAFAHQQEVAADTKQHQERVAEDARHDAAARRITDLYTKAVEQLGSDKAPVRLGGLYALELLAQANENQRQTIVNVLCAYLRMPEPREPTECDNPAARQELARDHALELEVRNTAQRLIVKHLTPRHGESYWGPRSLDLTGARLRKLVLKGCRVGSLVLDGAVISDCALFDDTVFEGMATFNGTRFRGVARFDRCEFKRGGLFLSAEFREDASFLCAGFEREANFTRSIFKMDATFRSAKLKSTADFRKCIFDKEAVFSLAEVRRFCLAQADFGGPGYFKGLKVADEADFFRVKFGGNAEFNDAAFSGYRADFSESEFGKEAFFGEAKFSTEPGFGGAKFAETAIFVGATLNGAPFTIRNGHAAAGGRPPWTDSTTSD